MMDLNLTKVWKKRQEDRAQQREAERIRLEKELHEEWLAIVPRKEHREPATEPGIIARVSELLQRGADIDSKDRLGWSALDRCTIWGYTETAMFLVSAGAKLSDGCIQQAAAFGDAELLKLMLAHGATGREVHNGTDVLSSALYCNGKEEDKARKKACAEALLEKGLTFDEKRHAPIIFTNSPWFAHHFPGLAEAKALQQAAAEGDLDKVQGLLAQGVMADSAATKYGADPALYLASAKGDVAMIETLVEAGADPNLVAPRAGQTPLQVAMENKHIDAFRKLWDLGAGFGGDSSHPMLMLAKRNGPEWEALISKCLHDEPIVTKKKTVVYKPLTFRHSFIGI